MKRSIKILLAVLFILIIIQFIPHDNNQSGQAPLNDITRVYQVPGNIEAIFKRSCYDCHSNNTSYPWYAHMQPVRLMLDRHISHGKKDLNFNEFGTYSVRRKRNKLRAIGNSISEGTMPITSYLFIHHNARLSSNDKDVILSWIKTIRNSSNE